MNRTIPPRVRRAFTLIELLAVMGILVLLAVLTVAGVGRISKDARISTAVNRITAALGNARAIAIKENAFVMVVFRPTWPVASPQPGEVVVAASNPATPQLTEIQIAKYSGETEIIDPYYGNLSQRFTLVPGVAPVSLPPGIKVAGPNYEWESDPTGLDFENPAYYTQPDFRAIADDCSEYLDYYRIIGVMFAPDGRRVLRLPAKTSQREKFVVDFSNGDRDGDGSFGDVNYRFPNGCSLSGFDLYHYVDHPLDETNVFLMPLLMVYDDDAAREFKATDWSTRANIEQELVGRETGFIARNGQRIDFNPATGVVQP
jgi:prepilin-type N-terminal cleavage/methylation domain-containing protein